MSDKPVKRFRIGFIEAAIWKNEGNGDKKFFSVKVSRSYKNGDDEYQSTDSFGHADLPALAKVVDRAETWISNQ